MCGFLSLLGLIGLLNAPLLQAADSSHLVSDLPGQPRVDFKQYAGQVTVNSQTGRALFYWFYEADQKNASSLPLAIWFNGGPGCSSVGNGALGELGPFKVDAGATGLFLNEFAWNKATIKQRFPEYSKNELYLTGESYAGHYVPVLATKIIEYNKRKTGFINFKGFAIGNPWTDAYFDNKGDTDFYHTHSMISDDTYQKLINNCDFANDLPVDAASSNPICRAAAADAFNDMKKIDVYSIYSPSCNRESRRKKKILHTEMLTSAYDPCVDSKTPYLNLEAVQKALNVNIRPSRWTSCSRIAIANYPGREIIKSMLPVYDQLLGAGLKIWIFSGDVDGVVSTIGTRNWIRQLNMKVTRPWYAWEFQNQVGGWMEMYTGLSLVTVRGAGHMVPFDKPEQALQVFKHFIEGTPLPSF